MNRKHYLLGWTWGIESTGSCGDFMHEVKVKRKPIIGGGRAVVCNETKVYPKKKSALKDAQAAKLRHPDWKVFLVGMCYETHKPEHAKGLPEWQYENGQREYVNS
jgi:hypothetical protein